MNYHGTYDTYAVIEDKWGEMTAVPQIIMSCSDDILCFFTESSYILLLCLNPSLTRYFRRVEKDEGRPIFLSSDDRVFNYTCYLKE